MGTFSFIFQKGDMLMHKYVYDGPVKEFDTLVSQRWKGATYAVSEKKARSNFAYQYKRSTNRIPATKIILPGKIEVVS